MKLNRQDIRDNRGEWIAKGYALPAFDIERMARETAAAPEWVHFGAGNIFRAFLASAQQQMLNEGRERKGIVAAAGYNYESVDRAYHPFDNLCLSVTLKAEGTIDKTVVASVPEALKMDPDGADWARLGEILAAPSLKWVSLTITEKSYNTRGGDGELLPAVRADFEGGPGRPQSYIGKVASLLHARFAAGALPVALVSMDNCSHNGTRLYQSMRAYAEAWAERGFVDAGFVSYMDDPSRVGFPWSMIDKITPTPDDGVVEILRQDGLEDALPVRTARGASVAPFVNAEETQYLVVEDWFPNGRPNIESAPGVMFTDRETVDNVERMKVCTCLNPLHTALAIFGCLLGFTRISAEMRDPDLKRLVEAVGYKEGLPVVMHPGIIDPREFIDTVVNVRLPNVFLPDSPQRIATDTSQKLPIRFGETVKAYLKRDDLSVKDLKIIPLVFAGWLRYLLGVDDFGAAFDVSPDPLLDGMRAALGGIHLGDVGPFSEALRPIFANAAIFGVDLYAAGLGELCEKYFSELVAGPGAVRATLQKYLACGEGSAC